MNRRPLRRRRLEGHSASAPPDWMEGEAAGGLAAGAEEEIEPAPALLGDMPTKLTGTVMVGAGELPVAVILALEEAGLGVGKPLPFKVTLPPVRGVVLAAAEMGIVTGAGNVGVAVERDGVTV
jgi:hypothetical protein